MKLDNLKAHDFLRKTEFSLNALIETDPRGMGHLVTLAGGLFVSHAGQDYQYIRREIFFPVIRPLFNNKCFQENSRTMGASHYRMYVQAMLHICDKFMVVVSQYSLDHEWVAAEVEWALDHQRPVVQCLLDNSDSAKIHSSLKRGNDKEIFIADFRINIQEGQQALERILRKLLCQYPPPLIDEWRARDASDPKLLRELLHQSPVPYLESNSKRKKS